MQRLATLLKDAETGHLIDGCRSWTSLLMGRDDDTLLMDVKLGPLAVADYLLDGCRSCAILSMDADAGFLI
jgi:hypothetical protein